MIVLEHEHYLSNFWTNMRQPKKFGNRWDVKNLKNTCMPWQSQYPKTNDENYSCVFLPFPSLSIFTRMNVSNFFYLMMWIRRTGQQFPHFGREQTIIQPLYSAMLRWLLCHLKWNTVPWTGPQPGPTLLPSVSAAASGLPPVAGSSSLMASTW